MSSIPLSSACLSDVFSDGDSTPVFPNSKYYNLDSFHNLVKQIENINHQFTVLNCNARSLVAHKSDYELLLGTLGEVKDFTFDVLSFTETWLDESLENLVKFQDYVGLFKHKPVTKEGGGIAMFIRQTINFKTRDDIFFRDTDGSQYDSLFIEVINKHEKNVIIGVIYRSPSHPTVKDFTKSLSEVLDQIQRENKNIILTGDFNIDLLQCNSDRNTTAFLDMITSFYLSPKITLPTRVTKHTATLIDHIHSNIQAEHSLSGTLKTSITDHYSNFIFIKSSDHKSSQLKSPNHISYRQVTDRTLKDFNSALDNETWQDVYNCSNPDIAYQNFLKTFDSLVNTHLPYKTVRFNKFKHKLEPWITIGLLKSARTKENYYIAMIKARHTDNFTVLEGRYKTYLSLYRKVIKSAKQNYWKNRFYQAKNDIKQTWSSIRLVLNKSNDKYNFPSEFWYNGNKISNNQEISNEFNNHFVKIGPTLASEIPSFSGDATCLLLQRNLPHSLFLEPTTNTEITNIINTLKPKTSSGYDGINPKLLKKCTGSVAAPIAFITNLSLETGIFPSNMKLAKVVPIFKHSDKSQFTNYRPISLLPAFSKILERVVHKRLYKYLVTKNLLNVSQYGFQKHSSTELAILELQDRIIQNLASKKWCSAIFLDLSKAFDTLDHSIMLSKLSYLGIRGTALAWFESYLSNRSQFIDFKGVHSAKKYLSCGVPQGSILGPLLFLVYINDLPDTIQDCHSTLFADDTTLLFSDISYDKLVSSMNLTISKVYKWLCLNKLSLNVDKTNYIIFRDPRKKLPTQPLVKLCSAEIKHVNETKFLGVYIDEHMNWKKHCKITANKCLKTLSVMHRLKHFLPEDTLLTIYHALFSSHLAYGITVFGNSLGKDIKRLKVLQRKAIRTVTKSKYNSHTGPLFKKLGILKFDDLFRQSCCKLYFRSKSDTLKPYLTNQMVVNSSVHEHFTRQATDIHQVSLAMTIELQSINSKVSSSWNELPTSVKDKNYHSLNALTKALKNHYLSKY